MKVELSIKDDNELRNYIRDMIRGQVTNIVREEVRGILNDTMAKHITAHSQGVPTLIQAEVKKVIRETLGLGSFHNRSDAVVRMVQDEINKVVREHVSVVIK